MEAHAQGYDAAYRLAVANGQMPVPASELDDSQHKPDAGVAALALLDKRQASLVGPFSALVSVHIDDPGPQAVRNDSGWFDITVTVIPVEECAFTVVDRVDN